MMIFMWLDNQLTYHIVEGKLQDHIKRISRMEVQTIPCPASKNNVYFANSHSLEA